MFSEPEIPKKLRFG
ncbi:MAG: hypothetical protein AB4290_15180 [Spirulina sp.]